MEISSESVLNSISVCVGVFVCVKGKGSRKRVGTWLIDTFLCVTFSVMMEIVNTDTSMWKF